MFVFLVLLCLPSCFCPCCQRTEQNSQNSEFCDTFFLSPFPHPFTLSAFHFIWFFQHAHCRPSEPGQFLPMKASSIKLTYELKAELICMILTELVARLFMFASVIFHRVYSEDRQINFFYYHYHHWLTKSQKTNLTVISCRPSEKRI